MEIESNLTVSQIELDDVFSPAFRAGCASANNKPDHFKIEEFERNKCETELKRLLTKAFNLGREYEKRMAGMRSN